MKLKELIINGSSYEIGDNNENYIDPSNFITKEQFSNEVKFADENVPYIFGSSRPWKIYQDSTGSPGNTQSLVLQNTVANKCFYIKDYDGNTVLKITCNGNNSTMEFFGSSIKINGRTVQTIV